ncbi:polysaccharide biosynthesis C-terminal domain-containing protein [Vibrio sp. qd031]|uniref:polysaccharide biosynthesis C-terminal domain-containing protein n=1 Tax=Vibrio sp. qd031 TaxID=1603038 RepID=UPI0015525276|nr:polysaccharide biosynthesis C-terminal domain-containing protein [Vibrio sp. qd031]
MSVAPIDLLLVIGIGEIESKAVAMSGVIIFTAFSMQIAVAQSVLNYTARSFSNTSKSTISYLVYGIVISLILVLPICVMAFHLDTLKVVDSTTAHYIDRYMIYGILIIALTSITVSLGFYLRSIGKSSIPFNGFCIEVPVNIILSFVLINGTIYTPALGLEGAAIGSLIGRLFRLSWMLYHSSNISSAEVYFDTKINDLPEFTRVTLVMAASGLGISLSAFVLNAIIIDYSAEEYIIYSLICTVIPLLFTTGKAISVVVSIEVASSGSSENLIKKFGAGILYLPMIMGLVTFLILFANESYYLPGLVNLENTLLIVMMFSLYGFLKSVSLIIGSGIMDVLKLHKEYFMIEQVKLWVGIVPFALFLNTAQHEGKLLYLSLAYVFFEVLTVLLMMVKVRAKKSHHKFANLV